MEPFVHDAVLDMQLSRSSLDATIDALEDSDWDRYVPYGFLTVRDVLAHLAAADHNWALASKGLLKGEVHPSSKEDARPADRDASIRKRRSASVQALRDEMARRRKLLLSLFDLLEPEHLALKLPSFGQHNSVRERIWLGYHDRLHEAEIDRARRLQWHPQRLDFLPEVAAGAASLAPEPTLYVVYSVDESWWEAPSSIRGWSYRNLLSHIATGDWVLQHHLRHIIESGRVADWPDVDAGNAERITERRFTTWQRLTDEYLSNRHETMRLLAQLQHQHLTLPIDLWWEPPERRRRTVRDYVGGFWSHDHQHREQLRPAMRFATSKRA
jgi:uncharacterized damage-inducible protein DinB